MSYFVRRGSSRLYVPRGFAEGEAVARVGQWVDRRYFSMMVNSFRFGGGAPPPADTYYVDTDGSNGDGSLATPWNSMENARAGIIALHSSLVTDTVNPTIIFSGATDDTTAVTNTWPTSSTTYYLTLKIPDADRKVQWDDNDYTLSRGVNGDGMWLLGTNSIRLAGLQLRQTQVNFASSGLRITSLGGEFVADGVKFRGPDFTNAHTGFWTNSAASGRFVLRNCLFWEFQNGIIGGAFSDSIPASTEFDVYNCTVAGVGTGSGEAYYFDFAGGGSGKVVRVKNCIATNILNNVTAVNHNTLDTATNYHGTLAADSGFVDESVGDLRIVSGSTLRKDAGTDLSGVSDFPFLVDAALTSRPQGSSWDIGMHEYA